jgi:hypothetical protein
MTQACFHTSGLEPLLYPVQAKGTFSCVAYGRTIGSFSNAVLVIFRGRSSIIPVFPWFKIVILTIIKKAHLVRTGGEAVTAAYALIIINDYYPVFRPLPGGIDRTDYGTRRDLAVIAD